MTDFNQSELQNKWCATFKKSRQVTVLCQSSANTRQVLDKLLWLARCREICLIGRVARRISQKHEPADLSGSHADKLQVGVIKW